MAIPTQQQLEDAERDLNDLESIVNGDTSVLVATRTGGNKPSVSKIVSDALAAEILGGGAGVVLPTQTAYCNGGNPPGDDRQVATLPQLDAGRYMVRLTITGYSGLTYGGDIALGFRFTGAAVNDASLILTVFDGTNSFPVSAVGINTNFGGVQDCIVSPIALPAPVSGQTAGGAGTAYNFGIAGQGFLDLASAVQPELVAYLVSGGAAGSDFSPSLREGAVEIIQVA